MAQRTHQLELNPADEIADRVVVMNQGKIEQAGTPTDVYRRPATRFVADFIGRANFVTGMVRDQGSGIMVIQALGATMQVPASREEIPTGAIVTLVVRPEMVEVDSDRPHAVATVHRAAYLGNVVEYDLLVGDHLLTVAEHDPRHDTIHAEGASVPVRLLEDCLYVLPNE